MVTKLKNNTVSDRDATNIVAIVLLSIVALAILLSWDTIKADIKNYSIELEVQIVSVEVSDYDGMPISMKAKMIATKAGDTSVVDDGDLFIVPVDGYEFASLSEGDVIRVTCRKRPRYDSFRICSKPILQSLRIEGG